jgi:hypothetical protein
MLLPHHESLLVDLEVGLEAGSHPEVDVPHPVLTQRERVSERGDREIGLLRDDLIALHGELEPFQPGHVDVTPEEDDRRTRMPHPPSRSCTAKMYSQSAGTRRAGPGAGWDRGWLSGGASAGPCMYCSPT